jgi:hypothetical protein
VISVREDFFDFFEFVGVTGNEGCGFINFVKILMSSLVLVFLN